MPIVGVGVVDRDAACTPALTDGGALTVVLAGAALFAGIARALLMLAENFRAAARAPATRR